MDEEKRIRPLTVGDIIKKIDEINASIMGLGTISSNAAGLLHEYAEALRALKVKVDE